MSLEPDLSHALQRAGYDGSAQVLQQILVALGLLQAGQPLRLLGSAWESNTETALPEALSDPQRRDLSDLSCFSIDSASTQEVDDAIGLERRDGKLWIWIHIADPHQWVEPVIGLTLRPNAAVQRSISVVGPCRCSRWRWPVTA